MADYTYRISASGTATGADAGFTTVNAAVADFVGNDRMGAGANGRVAASSTLYFKIDGFLSLGAADVYGIDTTTNSNAAAVVEAWSNPWNATPRSIGYTTSFDGVDMGTGAQFVAGFFSSRQAKLTVRNLVIRNNLATYGAIYAAGPSDGSSHVQVINCLLVNAASTNPRVVDADGCDLIQCWLYAPNGTTNQFIQNTGRVVAGRMDHCTCIALAGSSTFVNNQNDPLPLIKNSYVGGCTTFSSASNFSSSCVGNATDQASWTGPTGTLTSVALSTTNFENVTNGTEDFRVKSGSVLKTTGATRLASVLTDIFGTSRADPATIGAFEYSAGGGSAAGAARNFYSQLRRGY